MEYTLEALEEAERLANVYKQDILTGAMNNAAVRRAEGIELQDIAWAYKQLWDEVE